MFTSLTYNMKGFYTSVDYIRSEIDVSKPDVVFLQDLAPKQCVREVRYIYTRIIRILSSLALTVIRR